MRAEHRLELDASIKNNSLLIQKSNDASVYDSFLLTRVNRRRRKALRLTFLQMSLGNSGFRP
jgi:hypothetical protein